MKRYRVMTEFVYHDSRNLRCISVVGELIDVINRSNETKWLGQGLICPVNQTYKKKQLGIPAPAYLKTKRIGIWMYTTSYYSGGRVHIFQIAHSLASIGWEVFLITNMNPKWEADYPQLENLSVLNYNYDKIPPDLDMIMTDSKESVGRDALKFKQTSPNVPFFCFNFETPNWVAEFDKDYADALIIPQYIFNNADILGANSEESLRYLNKWVDKPARESYVIQPAINNFALYKAEKLPKPEIDRPYAVWSSRAPAYKGGSVALDAVFELDEPFDIVTFGKLPEFTNTKYKNNPKHLIRVLHGGNDVQKYQYMQHAHLVLAPSKFEGYGMVIGEALASGTQCVVYDLPVLREEYGERDGLRYVEWGNEKAFKQTVKELVDQPKHEPCSLQIIKEKDMYSVQKKLSNLSVFAIEKKKVSAHLSAYWGFMPESIESIYNDVDEIIITYGKVKHAETINDGTFKRIEDCMNNDPDKKIQLYSREEWESKIEMRNFACSKSRGNYLLVLDGDEVWTGLDKWLETEASFTSPRWLNFWHDINHWVHDSEKSQGERWGHRFEPHGSYCPHLRFSWYRHSYQFNRHHLIIQDAGDQDLHLRDNTLAKKTPESCIYHFGHALPENVMKAKHDFYLSRDGADKKRVEKCDYWHNWNGETGETKEGIISKVDFELPAIVKKAWENLKGMNHANAV